MNPADIIPGKCYQTRNGRIIRVMTVYEAQVHYDYYNAHEKKWEQSPFPMLIALIQEPANDPSESPPISGQE